MTPSSRHGLLVMLLGIAGCRHSVEIEEPVSSPPPPPCLQPDPELEASPHWQRASAARAEAQEVAGLRLPAEGFHMEDWNAARTKLNDAGRDFDSLLQAGIISQAEHALLEWELRDLSFAVDIKCPGPPRACPDFGHLPTAEAQVARIEDRMHHMERLLEQPSLSVQIVDPALAALNREIDRIVVEPGHFRPYDLPDPDKAKALQMRALSLSAKLRTHARSVVPVCEDGGGSGRL